MKSAMFTVAACLLLAASGATAQFQTSAAIVQNGIGNQAAASQANTEFNTARITQVGDGFSATVTQTGRGNRAGIQQH